MQPLRKADAGILILKQLRWVHTVSDFFGMFSFLGDGNLPG